MQIEADDGRSGARVRSVGVTTAVLAGCHALAMLDRGALAAVAPAMRADIAMTNVQFGALIGPAFGIAYGIAALAIAWRGFGIAPRTLMLAGLVVWGVAAAGIALAHGIVALAVARIAMGVGQAAFIPAALAHLIAVVPERRRAAALATFTGGSAFGRSAVLLVVGLLLAALAVTGIDEAGWGWRCVFLLSLLPTLAAIALVARLPRIVAVPTSLPFVWLHANAGMLLRFLALALPPLVAIQAIGAWLPTMLVATQGWSTAAAASFAGTLTIVAAPAGQLLGGAIATRRPRPTLVIPTALALAVPFVALAAWGGAPAIVGIGIVGFNLSLGVATFAALWALQPMVPATLRGPINGLYLAVVTLVALGIGPLLAAWASGGKGLASALVMTVGGLAIVDLVAALAVARRPAPLASA